MINIAVIGCGAVSITHHIQAILDSEEFNLTALVDNDDDAVELACLRFGLPKSILYELLFIILFK